MLHEDNGKIWWGFFLGKIEKQTLRETMCVNNTQTVKSTQFYGSTV